MHLILENLAEGENVAIENTALHDSGKMCCFSETGGLSGLFCQDAFGCTSLVAIGDGATDLEARGPGGADIFIG